MDVGVARINPVSVSGLFGAGEPVLRDISLQMRPGEAVGLLGCASAGKSTLLSHVLGLRDPVRGQVRIFGHRPRSNTARRLIGWASQRSILPRDLEVHEVVDFVGRHYEHPVAAPDLADRFGFGALLRRRISTLGPGEERQVTVALAFVGRPALVVLDEPTAGLDRDVQARIRSVVQGVHRNGTAVLVATSEPAEAICLADRVVLLRDGVLRFDGTTDLMLRQVGITQVTFRTQVPARLSELTSVVGVVTRNRDEVCVATNDTDGLLAELSWRQIPVTAISVRSASLGDVEPLLTGKALT